MLCQISDSITGSQLVIGNEFPLDSWHMFTMVYSTGTGTFYMDGVSQGTLTANNVNTLPAKQFAVGSDQASNQAAYCKVDETNIWNRALTLAEITQLYNSGAGKAYPYT